MTLATPEAYLHVHLHTSSKAYQAQGDGGWGRRWPAKQFKLRTAVYTAVVVSIGMGLGLLVVGGE